MAKQSGINKIIQELEADVVEHEREIRAKKMLIGRLQQSRPFQKPAKPRAVKKVDEKTA